MKSKLELTKEQLEMYSRAILEKRIDAKDMLLEIMPLLEECIIANFVLTNESLVMEMLNGQKFKITIEEV